jgi:hypothetical protein
MYVRNNVIAAALVSAAACIGLAAVAQTSAPAANASFFITSVGSGDGANLGGIAGADKHCAMLAKAAGLTKTDWRAYLSTSGTGGMNAKDRIGSGPWFNVKGVQVAASVADLHSDNNKLSKENSLTEKGMPVNGRGDTPNTHDVLTGSMADGTLASNEAGAPLTCNNWTSNAADGSATVGHHDRVGGGAAPTSWNASHPSRGCGQPNLVATGGAGLYYCFAR